MKIFNLEKARKHYDEIKDNPIYCTKTDTENTGGNFMVTEVPCTYQGMDCFLSYGWACPECGVMLFMNHYKTLEHSERMVSKTSKIGWNITAMIAMKL